MMIQIIHWRNSPHRCLLMKTDMPQFISRRLQTSVGPHATRAHPFRKVIASMVIAAHIALPGALHAEGLPDLGDSSDASLSEPQERAIGKRIMLEIRGDRAFVEDAELKAYIAQLGNRMIAASRGTTNDNRRDFEFFLLNDESINAFALLGGFIGLHTGLVLTSTTESELAGLVTARVDQAIAGLRTEGGPVLSAHGSVKTRESIVTKLLAKKETDLGHSHSIEEARDRHQRKLRPNPPGSRTKATSDS